MQSNVYIDNAKNGGKGNFVQCKPQRPIHVLHCFLIQWRFEVQQPDEYSQHNLLHQFDRDDPLVSEIVQHRSIRQQKHLEQPIRLVPKDNTERSLCSKSNSLTTQIYTGIYVE